MADRYDSNWQVFVNDEEQTIENFNGMRRISLPKGESDITFSCCPKMFGLGLVISVLTSLGVLIWLRKKH